MNCEKCGQWLSDIFKVKCNCKPFKAWAPDLDGEDEEGASTFHARSESEAAEKYLEDSNCGDFSESADVFVVDPEGNRTYWHVEAEPTVNYSARRI